MLRQGRMRRLLRSAAVDPQVAERVFDVERLHLRNPLHETTRCDDLIDDEFRLIGGQFEAFFYLDPVDDGVEGLVGKGEPHFGALRLEDATEGVETRRGHLDFVGQATQKGGVHQIFRLDIGGEDDELFKGNAETLAGVEFEVVDAVFERDDPAVEEGGGADELAAKVVDDEAATQRLDMEGRLVIMADGVVEEVEHLEGELAAGNEKGPAAGNPAVVENIGAGRQESAIVAEPGAIDGDVNRGVEDADDLALDGDGVGNVDDVAEHAGQAASYGGLSVSRRAVEQHGTAGGQPRPA